MAVASCVSTQVQEELMNEVWGEEVLKIPACRVMYGDKKQMLFHGPRVKMGIYEGVPTRVCPHTTSGRADYFGPLVNRCDLLALQSWLVRSGWWTSEAQLLGPCKGVREAQGGPPGGGVSRERAKRLG